MKKLVKLFLLNIFSLWLVSSITEGLVFKEDYKTMIVTGCILTLLSLFAKPIVNLLLLPLNMITFGLFSWVSSALVLYITTLLIKEFSITHFYFAGFANKWLSIPTISLSGVVAYIAYAFVFSLIYSILHWIIT